MEDFFEVATNEQKQQLKIIDISIDYIILIAVGIILSLYATQKQRENFICTVVNPECQDCITDVFPIRFI